MTDASLTPEEAAELAERHGIDPSADEWLGISAEDAEHQCNRYLAALGEVQAHMTANYRQRDNELARLDRWLTRVNEPLERQEAWLISALEYLSKHIRYFGKAKSREFPRGTVAHRTKPERIVIEDGDAALAWAKERGLAVVAFESVSHSVVAAEWKAAKEQGSDFVPPGCRVVPAEETFTAKPLDL